LYGLRACKWYQSVGENAKGLHILLGALWKAELAGHFRYYRLAALALADIGLEFGLEAESLKLMDTIIDQIINGGDLEERAYATLTFARTLILKGKEDGSSLLDALRYLKIAADDYAKLKMKEALGEVQGYLVMVYDRLGRLEERDAAIGAHEATFTQEQEAWDGERQEGEGSCQ